MGFLLKSTTFLGVLILIHSIFSAIQYKTEQEKFGVKSISLPSDIIIESILGSLLGIISFTLNAGKFQTGTSFVATKKPSNPRTYRREFSHFNHTGKVIANLTQQ
eukprot:gb/GECH01009322.1/.p1 GENE.gb/GECH01009322.1/~~gb/GECH01009322.1/.p1  ORF type:complete len:105 (+),score=18.18 gb/GECH01009322.1/:1-315(+)